MCVSNEITKLPLKSLEVLVPATIYSFVGLILSLVDLPLVGIFSLLLGASPCLIFKRVTLSLLNFLFTGSEISHLRIFFSPDQNLNLNFSQKLEVRKSYILYSQMSYSFRFGLLMIVNMENF